MPVRPIKPAKKKCIARVCIRRGSAVFFLFCFHMMSIHVVGASLYGAVVSRPQRLLYMDQVLRPLFDRRYVYADLMDRMSIDLNVTLSYVHRMHTACLAPALL
jgi:hypothetical protein